MGGDAGFKNARLEETTKNRDRYLWSYWKNFYQLVDPSRLMALSSKSTVNKLLQEQLEMFTSVDQAMPWLKEEKTFKAEGGKEFIYPLEIMMVTGFREKDPATQKILPVDVDMAELCCKWELLLCATTKEQH